MKFARGLMILGGMGLVAGGWVPTYVVERAHHWVARTPDGGFETGASRAVVASPFERVKSHDPGSYVLLIPVAFGLAVILVGANLLRPRVWLRPSEILTGFAILTALFAAIACSGAVLLSAPSAVERVLLAGAALASGFYVAAAARLVNSHSLEERHPEVRMLALQGLNALFMACWFIAAGASNNALSLGVVQPQIVGLPSIAAILVGSHLGSRAARNAAGSPGVQSS